MLNKSKKELQVMSTNTLEERLDCLAGISARLYDYRHVFNTAIIDGKLDEVEPLTAMVQNEINMIVDILESRELQH